MKKVKTLDADKNSKSISPTNLKLANVTPAYKKKPKNPKDNYRPVLMLSNISQIYEKCIYDQFSSFLILYCPNINGYNAQHCLITLIEKWKKSVYSKINSINERALRITHQDNTSTFQELLNTDKHFE